MKARQLRRKHHDKQVHSIRSDGASKSTMTCPEMEKRIEKARCMLADSADDFASRLVRARATLGAKATF
jgi:hypothetical protein